jgi:hypothetical protein
MRAFFPSGTLGGAEIIGGVQRQKHLEQQLLLPHLHVAVQQRNQRPVDGAKFVQCTYGDRMRPCVALCCAV